MKAPTASTAAPTTRERPRPLYPAELLSRLWVQNQPLMRERISCLERAAQKALEGELSEPERTEAIDLAHKLAGSLGMFGFPRGTEIAREIEQMLEGTETGVGTRFVRLVHELREVLSLPAEG